MLDSFGRSINYLRLSVTELCNLRCLYCMPSTGIIKKNHDEILTEEEMIMAVRAAVSLGLHKIRITGGEPLTKPNIISICEKIAGLDGVNELCLTTNETLLAGKTEALKSAGVQRVNISLDTLNPEKYSRITRLGNLSEALTGINAALHAGFTKVKINVKGFNDDEIKDLAALTYQYPLDVRFIELMPFNSGKYISCRKVLEILPEALEVQSEGVAKMYHLPGASGNVGLIQPVSCSFCEKCSRLRLTADGHVKPCLLKNDEFYLKGMNYDEMRQVFIRAINAKPAGHPELSEVNKSRTMNQRIKSEANILCKILLIFMKTARLRSGSMKKGDVLTAAQIAGIMGAKKTPDLIPMCHPILINGVKLTLTLNDENKSAVFTLFF